jgi:hypothetical protein
MVQTLASHAEFLGRLGKLQESLATIELVRQTGLALPYRETRRLRHTLAANGFDLLRDHPTFQLLMMDLAFPAQPFARLD